MLKGGEEMIKGEQGDPGGSPTLAKGAGGILLHLCIE